MEFKDRLKELRQAKNLTQSDLADAIKSTKQAISQYERGIRRPDFETLEALCDQFNVSSDYLLGKSDVTVRLLNSEELKLLNGSKGTAIRIPVYGRVAAGIPIEAIENIIDYEEIPDTWHGDYAALRVKGDSMEPRIMEGDVLIVKLQPDAESGDTVVAIVNGQDATVKKLIKRPDGIILQPSNPKYESMYFSADQADKIPVKIWGKVVENRQKF